MYELVKTVEHQDGRQRVAFYQRDNGTYFYEPQLWCEYEYHACWEPHSQRIIGIYDSLETAEREAMGNIPWLAEA